MSLENVGTRASPSKDRRNNGVALIWDRRLVAVSAPSGIAAREERLQLIPEFKQRTPDRGRSKRAGQGIITKRLGSNPFKSRRYLGFSALGGYVCRCDHV
eukprot:scaffold95068_cov47-Prasinocladus_malaysianus.AAC.1